MPKRSRLQVGRAAVVTGGSRWSGLGIWLVSAQLGASVLLASRRERSLAEAVSNVRTSEAVGTARIRVGSADSGQEARASTTAAPDRYGAADILVSNAARNPYFGPTAGIRRGQEAKTHAVKMREPLASLHPDAAWVTGHTLVVHGGHLISH